MSADELVDLVRRLQAGDEQAAAMLDQACRPQIQVAVRIWLRTQYPSALGRSFDSQDICQSVFKSFLIRAAAGQYDLSRPEKLMRLLRAMARKKLAHRARKEQRVKRDIRRSQSLEPRHDLLEATQDSPSDLAATKELLGEFRKRLLPEERELADMRAAGQDWSVIAARVGGSAGSCRQTLRRAVRRIALELKLDEPATA